MIKRSFLKYWQLLCLLVIISMGSCNDNNTDKNGSSNAKTDSSKTKSAAPALLVSGTLDTLFVDAAYFKALPSNQNLVFSFTFGQLDTLTLHGWSVKNNPVQFNPTPDIRLIKAKAGTYSYGAGTYFGNELLDHQAVKKVQDALVARQDQYVLFAPKKIDEHIIYDIYTSKVIPTMLNVDKQLVTLVADATANPSPPHNY